MLQCRKGRRKLGLSRRRRRFFERHSRFRGNNWVKNHIFAPFAPSRHCVKFIVSARPNVKRARLGAREFHQSTRRASAGGRTAGGSHSSLLTLLSSPISLLAEKPYCAKPLSPGTILASVREAPPFGVCRAGASSFFASRSDTARTAGGSHSSLLTPLSSPPSRFSPKNRIAPNRFR